MGWKIYEFIGRLLLKCLNIIFFCLGFEVEGVYFVFNFV